MCGTLPRESGISGFNFSLGVKASPLKGEIPLATLHQTPTADRTQIAIFGRRNSGKSSLINALTGQSLAIVSPVKGTTTDPVYKSMELLPAGPVTLIDTPGLDDEGELGAQRVSRARAVLNKADIALIVADAAQEWGALEQELADLCRKRELRCLAVVNKTDTVDPLTAETLSAGIAAAGVPALPVSCQTGEGIRALKERIAELARFPEETPLIADLLAPGNSVLLIMPQDASAPKGRLILPQAQMIREILDSRAIAVAVQPTEISAALGHLSTPPALAVTDSQVFGQVAATVPPELPLTSFSILYARRKGILRQSVEGVRAVSGLREGDRVLIAEGCTHHRQCDDIGSVKLPRWLQAYSGQTLSFDLVSGSDFPQDLAGYALIVHCGGCMLNNRQMRYRAQLAQEQQIPFTNYGILIAQMQGILNRSVKPLLP
jgi:[FeFe] hydrogenase H-cluster maturation GTPase HydF